MNDLPLMCNLQALPAEERELHGQRWAALLRQMTRHDSHHDGCTLWFPLETQTLELLMRVVANERLCCPFLHFQIEIAPGSPDVALTMRGPEGTRELLAAELGLPLA